MKTAVLHGPKDFRIEDVPEPEPAPDGAIVRVKAFGICGSELPSYTWGFGGEVVEAQGAVGASMSKTGHEFSGEVVEVGANVTNVKPGDRVAAGGYGGYSEYIHVPTARGCIPLPDDMSYEVGAMIEPVGIGVGVVTKAEPVAGDTVVVLGAGMIGQSTWQLYKAKGAARVIVTDLNQIRIDTAKKLGADEVINAAEEDAVAKVNELTDGMGADVVVDAAGEPETFRQMFAMARGGGLYQIQVAGVPTDRHTSIPVAGKRIDPMSLGGKVVFVGSYEESIKEWNPSIVYQKALQIVGNWGGIMGPAAELMIEGKVITEPLVTHKFPLSDINEAFAQQLKRDESVKVMVNP